MSDDASLLRAQCDAYRGVLDDIRKMTGGKRGSAIGAMADAVLRQNGAAVIPTIQTIRGRELAHACVWVLRSYMTGGIPKKVIARLENALDSYAALAAPAAIKDTSQRQAP